MKFQILALGVFLCLGAAAQGQTTGQTANPSQNQKSTQSANRMRRPAVTGEHAMTGCVDQQNGQYVLRNAKTDELINLQAPGNPDDYFARFVGHEVQVSGTEASGTLKITQIGQVADMCGTGK